MTEQEQPQIYLISPPQPDEGFGETLASILDARPIACFRLALAENDEDLVLRSADALREICHARDVPIVIERHTLLVERLGLDGVHLPDASVKLRDLRKDLGEDAIIGAFCGTTRHTGMTAAEAGADYVSFGPVSAGVLGDGNVAPLDLFEWWSEMIEVPVVAEGGVTVEMVEKLAPITDFLAVGSEIWRQDAPLKALADLLAPLGNTAV
ncbi:MAG: thiamine phosphate synthase [Paracoccaceae bacterium]|nr:thiamine phosphate synthase [Paracoccaceae bacterium]